MAMINNANDVLFDLCTRLKDNGVVAKVNGNYEFSKYNTPIDFVERISELDFSEHDKVFEDKIVELENIINHKLGDWNEHGIPYKEILDMKAENKELKKHISEFDSKETVELPFDALETANMLINATYKEEIPFLEKQVVRNVYDIDDLEQIAEHLLVYCKHNRDGEE